MCAQTRGESSHAVIIVVVVVVVDVTNFLEKKIGLCLGDGSYRKMTMQVARGVTKPLGSVSRICAAGRTVVFDDEGSFILNKQSGVKTWPDSEKWAIHAGSMDNTA